MASRTDAMDFGGIPLPGEDRRVEKAISYSPSTLPTDEHHV